MKKVIIIILILMIVILLGTAGFFLYKYLNNNDDIVQPSGDVIDVDVGLASKANVKAITIKEQASQNRYIDIVYPSIQSFKNTNFQRGINEQITKVINSYRNEISAIIDDETPITALYSYKVSYEKYAHGDYLSLVIFNDYQTGGIRSNTWKDIYNIDVRKERILYLADLFPANVDYKNEILNEIELQAEENNYVLMNGVGLEDLADKQKFYIKDDKLVIYFDPAEIAPAIYGALQFEMPFTLEEDGLFHP